MEHFLYYLLHIDTYLITLVKTYGVWVYLILFFIIFAETGLIVTPFLPGDSLLFAVGSLAAQDNSVLNINLLVILLIMACSLGNQVNYLIGRFIGPKIFKKQASIFFNPKHLQTAHQFYEKNGGKTLIMARFLPIIRTFAPFVAGASAMHFARFTFYNIISAIAWIGVLLGLGYFFGGLPVIKDNFSLVIYGIILITALPPIISFCTFRRGGS